ncbi:MAG: TetR/AcrR family transcriptional regulator [Acidobacteriota bacterium]|nr:TetR/AcrR family transcriptional regulator [Acidobacteriota bacterium]
MKKKVNRKLEIVAAAEKLLREKGLVGVTTRAIAAAVPCSEGAIYVHFSGRVELLLAVLEASLPEMLIPLKALEGVIGVRTPEQNMIKAVQGMQKFHARVAPMLSSLFAEPELLQGFRQSMAVKGGGPNGGIARIGNYIAAEQKLGSLSQGLIAEDVAVTLMSVSFFQAFTSGLFGKHVPSWNAARMVKSLLR